MTVTFTGHLGDLVWGSTRRWNAWVEFRVGTTLVASSANGDFVLMSGQVTEDISRSIRRDVQVQLLFPSNPLRRTVAAYALVTTSNPWLVGQSTVGGTNVVGGTSATTQELEVPAVTSDTARSVFVPTEVGDLLDPHSQSMMYIHAGFEGEEQQLGVFDLAETEVKVEAGEAVVSITGHSFERRLDLATFWQVEGFVDGANASDAAIILVYEALGNVIGVQRPPSSATIGALTWKNGDNRLGKINELLALSGSEGWFDRNNVFVVQASPTAADFGHVAPRWDVIDGVNARIATLNSASRKFSDADAFNGVVVEGTGATEPNAPPVFAVRWNLNPISPLYFDPANPQASGMGPRPKHVSSELVKTDADAQAMVNVEFAKILMISDSIEAVVPAHAMLEMGQYARLVCDALGVDDVYRINRVQHDLLGAPAQLTLYRFTGV